MSVLDRIMGVVSVNRLLCFYCRVIKLMMLIILTSSAANAEPVISAVAQGANSLAITGSSFGEKPTPAPYYFSNFDTETVGQMPTGQISNQPVGHQGTVQANLARSGLKSIEFDYCADAGTINWSSSVVFTVGKIAKYNNVEYTVTANIGPSTITPDLDSMHFQVGRPPLVCTNGIKQDHWIRNAIDLGSSGSDKIYMSLWLYLDKGVSTSKSWQWKNFIATSNSNLYVSLNNLESAVFFEPWYFNNVSWGNSGSPHVYYWDVAQSRSILSTTTGAPADSYLWKEWQRIDLYLQRSSSGGVADGIVYFNRMGRSSAMVNKTNVITHVAGDNPWRYLDLSNGIASVYEGFLKLNVRMDDVYVDTTQARVEICDTQAWADRTHCEIQPATEWTDGQITVNFNRGNFTTSQDVYAYVVDSNGVVNSTGSKFTIRTPAPTAPKNVTKVPITN